MTLSLITHTDCLDHNPGSGHPENAQRLARVLAFLDGSDIRRSIDLSDAPLGTDEQILLAHSPGHLEKVKARAPETGEVSLDPDTHMSPGSLNAARRAIGATCRGVDSLMSGDSTTVFCATRPPGHHATPDRAMGFCIFNQIAIAAIHAKHKHGLDRVAIVDFDVHHGNGTQDILKGKDGLFYISTHQSPLYPGTGMVSENLDNNIFNLPLTGGTGHQAYKDIFEAEVIPALKAYRPQLLLVSAGFDAHRDDPLAGLALTDDTYYWLGSELKKLANECCDGKMLSTLEGGYNLGVLPGSVMAYLRGSAEIGK